MQGLFLKGMALLITYLFFALNFIDIVMRENLYYIYNNIQLTACFLSAYRFTLGDACNQLIIYLVIVIPAALTGGIIAYFRDY